MLYILIMLMIPKNLTMTKKILVLYLIISGNNFVLSLLH